MFIIDGLSDDPIPELGGKTTLEAAFAPNMHYVANRGRIGRIATTFEGFPVESMVCIMGLLGYDPARYYPAGRAAFEALARGLPLRAGDLAFRCNIVTVDERGALSDFTAGMISDSDARKIMARLQLPYDNWEVHPGQSYRNILIVRGAGIEPGGIRCLPPHQHIGELAVDILPSSSDPGARQLMQQLGDFLLDTRPQIGAMDLPERCRANMLWLWSPSKRAVWPTFRERTGMRAAFVGGLDFLHGIAMSAGIHFDIIPGATGYIDTDYDAKSRYACQYLQDHDFVLVHVNAADEAGHQRDPQAKIDAIEQIDHRVLGPLLIHLNKHYHGQFRVMVCGDHKTRCSDGRHLSDPVPYALFGAGIESSAAPYFGETTCAPYEPVPSLEILSHLMV